MQRIYRPPAKALNDIGQIAVAIIATGSNQRHVGFLCRLSQEQGVKFLHLAWHNRLRCDDPADSYIVVDPKIHPRRAVQLAARCRQIWRANGKYIPYGFSMPTDNFDRNTSSFLFGPTNTGLTCSTFVLAVFEFASLHILDYASWKARPDDKEWQAKIISMLECSNADPEHIDAIRKDIGSVRFRPEEVAASAGLHTKPASFQNAELLGWHIAERARCLRVWTKNQ